MTEYYTYDSGSFTENTVYTPSSVEEEVSWFINSIRFRMKYFINDLCGIVKNGINEENLEIEFKMIGRQLKFLSPETPKKFVDYLKSILENNQIFEDYSFYPVLNEKFKSLVGPELQEKRKLGEECGKVKEILDFGNYIGHFLPSIKKENFAEALAFIITSQFVQEIESNDNETEFVSEKIGHGNLDMIPLFSNNFHSIFIAVGEDRDTGEFDYIYIALVDRTFEELEPKKEERLLEAPLSLKKFKPTYLAKYESITKSHIQVSKASVAKLVKAMDSNGDDKITLEDIRKFSHKHFLYLDEEIYKGAYEEAKAKRNYRGRRIVEFPLSIDEIHRVVQLKMLKKEGKWKETESQFRYLWIQFLEFVGESNYNRERLPVIKAREVNANFEKSSFSYKPSLLQKKPSFQLQDQNKKTVMKSFRPEAGIYVVDTPHIHAINVEGDSNFSEKRRDPFETVVNARISNVNENQTISFKTKQYFNEALKLSKTKEPQNSATSHPIYSFVPQEAFQPSENKMFRGSTLSMVSQKTLSLFTSMEEQKTQDESAKEKDEFGPKKRKPFLAAFQPEDCLTLKKKLASKETRGLYNPPTMHRFRDEVPVYNKEEFKIRIKGGIEDVFEKDMRNTFLKTDFRSQEFLEKALRQREKELEDWQFKNKVWVKYFRLADKNRNFVTHKYPEFLDKEEYEEPIEMVNNLIRQGDEDLSKDNFHLFFGTLTTKDKNLFLGEQIDIT